MNGFGSRKLLLAVAVETAATFGLYFGLIDSDQWGRVTMAVLGFYTAGNAAEHATNAWKARSAPDS